MQSGFPSWRPQFFILPLRYLRETICTNPVGRKSPPKRGAVVRGIPVAVLIMLAVSAARAWSSNIIVYWDQNEEEQFFIAPAGPNGVLVPTWDTNGQMSIIPDRSGRFVTGYNPTLLSQGLGNLPLMDPPVGEAVWNRHGSFTGQTIFVPGPWANPGSTVGCDIPPDTTQGCVHNSNGTFSCPGPYNDNGTYLGAVFDSKGDLFAGDIGQAQGQFPVPDNGRLIEWFPPDYSTYCILFGPTQGGDPSTGHHVDGSGGLRDPGTLAVDSAGNVYLPEAGNFRVLKFVSSSFPSSATQCKAPSNMPASPVSFQVFIQGSPAFLTFPSGIARDSSVHKWAVSSVIGSPAVAWFNDDGTPYVGKGPLLPGNYSPLGITFTPAGDLYFVDIHISCTGGSPEQTAQSGVNCGPVDNAGNIFRVTFTAGVPSKPVAIATGLNFPTSVTSCNPNLQICPTPP